MAEEQSLCQEAALGLSEVSLNDGAPTAKQLFKPGPGTKETLAIKAESAIALTMPPKQMERGKCSRPNCTSQATVCCSKCKSRYYCSKACQETHWKIHEQLCWDEDSNSDSGSDSSDSDVDTGLLRASFARCEEIKIAAATKNQSSGQDQNSSPRIQQYPLFNFASRKKGHLLGCFCCTPVADASGRLL